MVARPDDLYINPPADVARFCIAKLGLQLPIHVVTVSRACGVPVLPLPPGGPTDADAFLAYHPPDCWAIFVAPGRGSHRRRFSIAHELGHYLLHRDLIAAGQPLNLPRYEWEANEFAAELLMPADRFRAAYRRRDQPLQQLFDVSRTALEVRLRRMGFW